MHPFESFIAYAPRGGGLLCALAYFNDGEHVNGWFIGLHDYRYPTAYFRVENFFSPADKRFYASAGSDIYGGWQFDYGQTNPALTPPVRADDSLCHVLDQLEDAFAAEWLAFRGQPSYSGEEAWYASEGLAGGDVLIRHARFSRFDRDRPVWTHYSRGFNDEVLAYMSPRWPLDYGHD